MVAGTKIGTCKDASGSITISVFSGESPTSEHRHNGFEVTVEEGMVCIGGGGTGSEDPGHFLTASEPNDLQRLDGWKVSSKDHEIDDSHILKVYAIGMKIEGLSFPYYSEYAQA